MTLSVVPMVLLNDLTDALAPHSLAYSRIPILSFPDLHNLNGGKTCTVLPLMLAFRSPISRHRL